MSGRQLLDADQSGAARDVLEREERVDSVGIDLAGHAWQAQQRLQLGGEREAAVSQPRPEQRLLADPIACEDEALAAAVPEGHGEHAEQVLGEGGAVLLVQVGDDGRVAGAADLVPALRQLVPELEEVVDLAVEDADDVAGLVLHGLAAGDEVDHLQAAVAEHAASERVHRPLVRPAVEERGVHLLDEGRVRLAGGC